MKFIPISEQIIDKALKKELSMWAKVKKLGKASKSDDFWAINMHREFKPENNGQDCLTIERIGDIWRCDFMVNGHKPQEAYSLWRDYPNYHNDSDGKSMDEVLKASETEKILYTCDEYRIILLRDRILGRTDTHWGYRIQDSVYALVDNKTNEIIIREEKKWRFKKLLMNGLAKEKKATSFVDEVKKLNPFRLFVVNATDTEGMEQLQDKLEMYQDTPINRFSDELHNKTKWICYAFGHDMRKGSYSGKKNATWWFVTSRTKPTYEECLTALKDIIEWYEYGNLLEMLKKYKHNHFDLIMT